MSLPVHNSSFFFEDEEPASYESVTMKSNEEAEKELEDLGLSLPYESVQILDETSEASEETPVQDDDALDEEGELLDDEAWRRCDGLPNIDMSKRDWTRMNRKMSYLYPDVIIPGYRRATD